jgi:hypothetical protein
VRRWGDEHVNEVGDGKAGRVEGWVGDVSLEVFRPDANLCLDNLLMKTDKKELNRKHVRIM